MKKRKKLISKTKKRSGRSLVNAFAAVKPRSAYEELLEAESWQEVAEAENWRDWLGKD